MKVVTAQGRRKVVLHITKGTIVAFHGPRIPSGWLLCDGTLGTPDLRDRVLVGRPGGADAAGGTESPTSTTHSGFALGNHSNHSVTQPGAHSNHTPTQAAAHSNHVMGQYANHPNHALGTDDGAHTHDSHTTAATGPPAVTGVRLKGPAVPHATDGAHAHDAHSVHANLGVNAHSAHSGFAVDAHSAHTGFAVNGHSAHSVTQADPHEFKVLKLAWIMKT